MRIRFRTAGGILCLLVSPFLTGTDAGQKGEPSATPPRVGIFGTQTRKLTSSVDGQEYELYVALPFGYSGSNKTFPVLYLLDGQFDFPLVAGLLSGQWQDGFVPPLIVVGITWAGERPNYSMLRARDLTPTKSSRFPSGNAPNFLTFIKKDAIPFIESNYRTTKNERTLMGSSLGGLFTLYALFHETSLFNRYVLTSPSLGWDNGILLTYEKEFAEKNKQLPVRLFMGVGEFERPRIADFQSFVARLKARNYQGLELETMIIQNAGHASNKAEGFQKGLQAVFGPPRLTIASAVLDQYVGKYQSAGASIDITREGNSLFLTTPDGSKFKLDAFSETDFNVRGVYFVAHFRKDASGAVSLEAEMGDGPHTFEKVKSKS